MEIVLVSGEESTDSADKPLNVADPNANNVSNVEISTFIVDDP